jgi:hypothetical protein
MKVVKEAAEQAIHDMEYVSAEAKKLAEYVGPNVTIDEMVHRLLTLHPFLMILLDAFAARFMVEILHRFLCTRIMTGSAKIFNQTRCGMPRTMSTGS